SSAYLHGVACECRAAAAALAFARCLASATGETAAGVVMSMRVSQIVTHLRPEDVCSIIEFLDQVRDMLMKAYGDEIETMLQEAPQCNPLQRALDDEPF
ncbi:hypothetical protein ACO0LC_28975, partial [Undibacterium sp. JH2W]|uniref:hypothetical protein n=1 Tax=Undibacterium sp. JH2W TaxID=3413037 RepID=UPI003BF3ED0E